MKLVEDLELNIGINPFDFTSINFELEGVNIRHMNVGDIIDKLLEQEASMNI